MSDKVGLRRMVRERLRELSTADRIHLGERIAERVWSLDALRSARTILLYADLPPEVPTTGILRQAADRGIAVAYPRCLPEGNEMTLHTVGSEEDLSVSGRYGIREPAPSCPTNDVGDIDVAFIPGLAWDRRGGRLGRGAGFYDRLMASPRWRAFRCGIFFALQEVPEIPVDPWDVPLDAVVTEDEIWTEAGDRK